jgi:uncharacterized protein DUF559
MARSSAMARPRGAGASSRRRRERSSSRCRGTERRPRASSCTRAACAPTTSSSMPVFHPRRSRGRSSTSPPATTNAPSSEPSPKPSSTTTHAPPTSKPPSAGATPAAQTSEPRSNHTPQAMAKSRAASSAASARCSSSTASSSPPQRTPRPRTIDCLWPHHRVAVELDGRQHDRPRQADRDDDRDLWLRRHGYIPRRYGERQVKHRPDDVIADLEDAFAQASALGYANAAG